MRKLFLVCITTYIFMFLSGCGVHSVEQTTTIEAPLYKGSSADNTNCSEQLETSDSDTTSDAETTPSVPNRATDTTEEESSSLTEASYPPVSDDIKETVSPSELHKVVYLTFDDGPSKYTEELLDILAKYNVKATFFTVGSKYEDIIKKEYEAGHTVAVHTATHDYSKIYKNIDAYFEDLYEQQATIKRLTGIEANLIRFPGGSSNSTSKLYCPGIMTVLTNEVTERGFYYFDWNVSSGDGSPTSIGTEKVFSNVTEGIKAHDISVVLQHDSKKYSIDAVESIIKWGLENGYTFLPLDENSFDAHHTVTN